MTVKLAFIAFCLMILGAESFNFRRFNKRKRDPPSDNRTCTGELEYCSLSMKEHYRDMEAFFQNIYQDGYLDDFCNDALSTVQCSLQRAREPYCDEGYRQEANVAFNIVNYLCSNEGKLQILSTEQSNCAEKIGSGYEGVLLTYNCARGLNPSDPNCDSLHNMHSCISEAFAVCGDPVVELLSQVMTVYFMTYFPELQDSCESTAASRSSQVTSQFPNRVTRAVDPVQNRWECNQAIESCTSAIVRQYGYVWRSGNPEEFIYQDGFIDGVCSEVKEVVPCLQQVLQDRQCSDSWSRAIPVVANLTDIACSDQGKQLMLATADSACWQDKDMGARAIINARGCYGIFMFGSDGTCKGVDEMHTCIIQSLTPCGTQALNLFDEAWPTLMAYFPDLQSCVSTSA